MKLTCLWTIICELSGETEYLANPWENLDGADIGVGSVSLAFYSGLFAYAGW